MPTTVRYTTFDEAIAREVIEPIEADNPGLAEDYDIKAIAEEVIDFDSHEGVFVPRGLDHDEFWAVVATHERTEFTARWKESGYANYTGDDGEQVTGFWLDVFADPDDDPIDGFAVILTGDMDPEDFTDAHRALTRKALAEWGFTPVNTISGTTEFMVRRTVNRP